MIKTLLKLRLSAFAHAMLNRSVNRGMSSLNGKKAKILLWAFLYLYIAGVFMVTFGGALYAIAMLAFSFDLEWFYFSMFVLLAFMMMFIGSIFTTKSQLFEAKDNEMLFSLPIRPRDIFISRMLSVLVINLLLEMIIVVPAIVVWILFGGEGGVLAWVFFAVTALLLPFFSFAVSGVFAWLLSLLNAKLKNTAWVTSVIYVFLFMGYFYLVSGMQERLLTGAFSGEAISKALRGIAPLYWFGASIANANVLQLLYSCLIYLIPFGIVFFVLSKSFSKICLGKSGVSLKKRVKTAHIARIRSPFGALLAREFKRLISSSTYLLNAGLGIPLSIVAVCALAVKGGDLELAMQMIDIGTEHFFGLIMILALCFLCGTCLFTAPSVSLEGKQLAQLRSLPVPTENVIRSKLAMHCLILMPTQLICSTVILFTMKLSLPIAISVLIVPQLYAIWTANIGMICGIHHPMLEWTNEAFAVKQGTAIWLSMLLSTFPAIALAAGAIALSFVSPWLSLAGFVLPLAAADLLSYRYLMHGGVKRFEAILA
jgi:ABC-2 type transport system permease protein